MHVTHGKIYLMHIYTLMILPSDFITVVAQLQKHNEFDLGTIW